MSLLHYAVSQSNMDLVYFLIENNCDVNRATPRIDFNGISSKLRHNRRRDRLQLTCLFTAICRKDIELLKALILGGADVNLFDTQMCSALWHAVDTGNLEITKLVMDAPNCNINFCDGLRMAPIHVAAIHGYVDILNLLLDSGAKMEPRQLQGATPLYLSCYYGREGTKHLLQHGCNPNIADHYGLASLCAALKHRNPSRTVYMLIDSGATVTHNQMERFLADDDPDNGITFDSDAVQYVKDYCKTPRKLKILVSVMIRELLKGTTGSRSIQKKCDLLPLPTLLLSYVKLEHL